MPKGTIERMTPPAVKRNGKDPPQGRLYYAGISIYFGGGRRKRVNAEGAEVIESKSLMITQQFRWQVKSGLTTREIVILWIYRRRHG